MTETVIGRDLFSPDHSPTRQGPRRPQKDEWSMFIHLNASSTMQVAIVERVCYTTHTERSASENLYQSMTIKDDGKRSAGTVWISMRLALAYEYEVLRGCACEDYPCLY